MSHGQPADNPFHQPKAVWAVAFACVISFMGIGLVDPILPALAGQLKATPSQVELLFTSYLVVTAVMMLVTGWVSSRLGAKRTLITGLIIIVIFAALAGAAGSIGGIIGFRAGWGLGNALFIATSLSVIVASASGGFAGAIVLYETALGLGIATGPLLGGVLGTISWRGPFFGVSVLMGISLIATIVLLPPTAPPKRKESITEPIKALRHRSLATTSVVGLLYNWGFFTLLGYSPFLMHLTAIRLGVVFFGWGVLVAVFAVWGAPALKGRFGTPRSLYVNFVLLAADLAAIGIWPDNRTVVIVAVIVAGAFVGVNNTLVTTAVMSIAPVERPVASATYGFVRFIGGGLAPFAAAKLVEHYNTHVPFLLGTATLLGAALVLSTVHAALDAADRGEISQPEADDLGRVGREQEGQVSVGPGAHPRRGPASRVAVVSARAGIIVTGTEVLTGRVSDLNGPWLAEQLRLAGVDVGFTVVVGDRPGDLVDALDFLASVGVDLVVTSGGLGPTADDLTAAVVGDWQGRPSSLDEALEARITAIVERLRARRGWTVAPEAMAAGTAKQALVPEGAEVLEPSGTAPGLVVPGSPDGQPHPPVLVLPGPPAELQAMWPAATASPLVSNALHGRAELRQSTVRLWGTPEAAIAATLRRVGNDLAGLEITTCLRGGELEVVTRYGVDLVEAYDRLVFAVQQEYGDAVFSTDGSTVDDLVADTLESRGLTIATAESCTAGLLAGRLTERAGSSAWVRGGLVVYSNQAKHQLAGVPTELIETHGAVSEEVAVALAEGARRELGADIGVGITGIAGPGGGTALKPVGLVHLCVAGPGGHLSTAPVLGGGRAQVRARSVTVALHLVRELLEG